MIGQGESKFVYTHKKMKSCTNNPACQHLIPDTSSMSEKPVSGNNNLAKIDGFQAMLSQSRGK